MVATQQTLPISEVSSLTSYAVPLPSIKRSYFAVFETNGSTVLNPTVIPTKKPDELHGVQTHDAHRLFVVVPGATNNVVTAKLHVRKVVQTAQVTEVAKPFTTILAL